MQLTGRDGNAALLLLCILARMPKAKAQHNGHAWIARSAADWRAEAGLSMQQYHRAVAKLRDQGLAVTEQHLFGDKNITHLRLLGAALNLVPAPAQPATEAPAQPELPAPSKAVLTGTENSYIADGGNLAASGGPLSSGTKQPPPPASGGLGIPETGKPGTGKPEIGKLAIQLSSLAQLLNTKVPPAKK